ncbi:interferon-inducible GTPase 5-like [Alosa pseudoharengus]|uniref:interferon-inducible GTPase 5-like n=1 Tax=Alosa pseudoharengus TaxID=34774 RepID=UPI003F8C9E4E
MAEQVDPCALLLKNSGEKTVELAMATAQEVVNRLDNVVLNIAISGETGAGKSSLVNAIRGLTDTDDGAAPTGVTQTTSEPTPYPHPTMENVTIWDLPGTGEPGFKPKKYIKTVQFKTYDFFIIVSATRFRQNDIVLAKEIKRNKKKFYFVRTKIDRDVEEEVKKGVLEEQTLPTIREDCEKNLNELESPPVFLITSRDLSRFDFQNLVETLEAELPEHKTQALVLSLPVYSQRSLEKKYNIFKKAAWASAITAGAVGGIPVPMVSIAFEFTVILSFLTKCYFSFGLDDKTLAKLSKRVDQPIQEMVRESSLVMAVAEKTFNAKKVAARLSATGGMDALCSILPVAGCIVGVAMSFITTQRALLEGLNEFHKLAKKVIEMAKLE